MEGVTNCTLVSSKYQASSGWNQLLASTVVLQKRAHGRSTLQVCQRGGWALFWLFPHLTTKERPHHVYSDLKPSKQIFGHKIMHNVITSGFKVESWRWAYCSSWLVSRLPWGCYLISHIRLCKDALVKYYTKFLTWDTHSAWGCASQTPCEARSRVGAHSGKLWPYTRNWAKSRGWALFREWAPFLETTVKVKPVIYNKWLK